MQARPVPLQGAGPFAHGLGQRTAVGPTRALRLGHRQVGLFDIFANHVGAAELRRQQRHAAPDPAHPRARQAGRVAVVELRNDLLFERIVQACEVARVDLSGFSALAVADRPADVFLVGLVPPAVEDRAVEAAVDQHLHAARSAGFPRATRRIDPDIDALDELLRERDVVVFQEDDTPAIAGVAGQPGPGPDHRPAYRL